LLAQRYGVNVSQLNQLPTFNIPLSKDGITNSNWYFFWTGLYSGLAPAAVMPVKVTASPFTYSATVKGSLIVNGGTVSLIQFSRDGKTFYTTGQAAGMFTLNSADRLVITYTVVPTVTFVPT
jgi:hypothetical protein